MQHRTTNGVFYVTTDNGTTWQQVSTKPVVGTQVYHDATSDLLEDNDFDLTPTQLNALTTAIDIDFDTSGDDNHNDWHEHNKRNRYYTTQYLTDGTDYFISNDFGYNWIKVTSGDITNIGNGNTNMGYEIVHQPTLTILTDGRLLLTSSELDALLNTAKYADTSNSIGQTNHAITQSDGTTSLAGEYVSHRLLTR